MNDGHTYSAGPAWPPITPESLREAMVKGEAIRAHAAGLPDFPLQVVEVAILEPTFRRFLPIGEDFRTVLVVGSGGTARLAREIDVHNFRAKAHAWLTPKDTAR